MVLCTDVKLFGELVNKLSDVGNVRLLMEKGTWSVEWCAQDHDTSKEYGSLQLIA